MRYLLLLPVGCLSAWAFWSLCRCHHRSTILVQKRDSAGKPVKPHTLQWECVDCLRIVGETRLLPRFKLLSFLRAQANRIRRVA